MPWVVPFLSQGRLCVGTDSTVKRWFPGGHMEVAMPPKRKPSYRIKPEDVPGIKKRIREGEFLNRIAADLDVNPGRIAEIKKGDKFPEIPAAE